MLWSQRRNSGAHGAENLIQISALAGLEPRTLAPRLPRTPPFSRLLRHAGGYSRTILTPNLQGYTLLQSANTPALSVWILYARALGQSSFDLYVGMPVCMSVCCLSDASAFLCLLFLISLYVFMYMYVSLLIHVSIYTSSRCAFFLYVLFVDVCVRLSVSPPLSLCLCPSLW